MNKINEIIIGTNNEGKYREICGLLPNAIKKYSPKEFNILSPEETGNSFEENSAIKARYFSKKTQLICLSDDSGLEINLLKKQPGIYSSRWSGEKNNFEIVLKKVFFEMKKKKKDWTKHNNKAQFVCCMTLCWPNGKIKTSKGIIKGRIANEKKGNNGFGYDPIFIPDGYNKTFAEMNPELKTSIDHRFKAYSKIKNFFI